MPDWQRAYLLLVALMVTAFTVNGLLALRVITARRGLLSIAIAFLLPAPLLFRGALDLYAVFAIQTAIIVVTIAFARWRMSHGGRQARNLNQSRLSRGLPLRFSIFALLLLVTATAVALTAVIQLPKWQNLLWRTVVISSFGAAAGTLSAAWFYNSKRRWIVAPFAIAFCIAIGGAVSELDWFFESTLQMAGWPPTPITPQIYMGSPQDYDDFDAWYFIPLLIAVTTLLFISVRATRALYLPLTLVVGALPLAAMIALLLPAPLPSVESPIPNGHEDFKNAARVAGFDFGHISNIDTAGIDSLSPLAEVVAKIDSLVAAGLEKQTFVPTNYFSSVPTLSNPELDDYYRVGMALSVMGRLAVLADQYDDAAEHYLRATQFGFSAVRGGMLWDGSLIRSRSALGARGLYAIRENLSNEALAHCVERLSAIDAVDESMEDVLHRHRVWTEHRKGWNGHLKFLLEQVAVGEGDRDGLSSDYWHRNMFKDGYRRAHAILRLLICELAIIHFHRDHGRYPEALVEMTPNYLRTVPLDPWDEGGQPLKYRRGNDSYVLYSLHANGVDDGGQPTHPAEWDIKKFRDLRLDYAFQ